MCGFFRELQAVNLGDVFGTEGKSNLGFFLVPILSHKHTSWGKNIKRNQRKKVKSQRHVTLESLFEFSEYDYIFVIIINTFFYVDLEVTSKIM